MRSIDDQLLASSVLIRTDFSTGSGFLFSYQDKLFLVTAKHVLFNEERNNDFISKEVEIVCPSTELEDRQGGILRINLEKAKYKYSLHADLAVILIGILTIIERVGNNYTKETITYEHYVDLITNDLNLPLMISETAVDNFEAVLVSNDIFLFGYPTSLAFGYFSVEKPLIKKGIISGLNRANKTIILDCAVYPGNSGGPVFQLIRTSAGVKMRIIGVVSKYIPFKKEWRHFRDRITNVEYLNSGYSVATSIDVVIDLLKEF